MSRRAVDVVEEGVERLDALLQPRRQRAHSWPDRTRGMMSNGMIRSAASVVAIDGEGDADPAEEEFRLLAAMFQQLRRGRFQPVLQDAVRIPAVAVMAAHLVEDRLCRHRVSSIPRCGHPVQRLASGPHDKSLVA